MASGAAVDAPLAEPRPAPLGEETGGRSTRRGRSRKRKSGEDNRSEGKEKKRTFDNFFNFCSFVLAYEEQLERQATTSTNNTPSTNGHTLTNSNSTSTTTTIHHCTNDHPNHTTHSDRQLDPKHSPQTESPVTAHSPPTPPPPNTHHHQEHTVTSSTSSTSDSSESGEEERERGASATASNDERLEYTSEDESWNLVTCFCRRPFAGRPMIECSKCNTWVHLFCAKIRKSAVPDVYTCPRCSPKTTSTTSTRRSATSAPSASH